MPSAERLADAVVVGAGLAGLSAARALRCAGVDVLGPLHWAGAEVATRWTGYMDGAIRSGEEAAAAVLVRL